MFPVQVVWQHVLPAGLQVNPAAQVLLHVPPQPFWTAAHEAPAGKLVNVVLLQVGCNRKTAAATNTLIKLTACQPVPSTRSTLLIVQR
jgi:hypothetical protein